VRKKRERRERERKKMGGDEGTQGTAVSSSSIKDSLPRRNTPLFVVCMVWYGMVWYGCLL
jgi:hypothetical protein